MAKGSRSISDLVRNSMREQVAIAGQNSALASTVTHHEVQVKDLEQKIEKLSAEIASLRAQARVPETDRPESNMETAPGQGASEEE